jgi:phosphate/sulfate permease
MDFIFVAIIVCLFVLAIFDLFVGVSNDAVNFLNSALGAKAASFKTILTIAAIGVFIGAVMSNGMMDIARHGIFNPEHFSFFDVICIFMAVMVADIILLDIFNSLGMPTSTTVSMVFALLGASFAVAILKMQGDDLPLRLDDLINTEKALSVILGIFLSVAIAFFFGTIVQFITRLIFTFNYVSGLKWKIGVFGGIAVTSIIYFLLLKGIKDMSFMTPHLKSFIAENTTVILLTSFVFFTLVMQVLHLCRVNVLKVIVLTGTFALAMAFAGNDLVNFIGVPLSGLSAWNDFVANGNDNPYSFMMYSLRSSANTPFLFLFIAGVIMVVSLASSKKAQKVSKTEIGLGSQSSGDEMFGSSPIARRLVRMSISSTSVVRRFIPNYIQNWINSRFAARSVAIDSGAAFDLVRASVNLMLAGMLIALGTSLKLPLSTTFVTFMVAMGTSLADRAWGRDSAVFRITGVISVIGGWFITAGAAFIGAALIALVMHVLGTFAIIAFAAVAIFVLIRSNIRYNKKAAEQVDSDFFAEILSSKDKEQAWILLKKYMAECQKQYLYFAADTYSAIVHGFADDDVKPLSKVERTITKQKAIIKNERRKQTLCLRQIDHQTAIEKSAWFHIANNACLGINYNLRRINEVCKEHVDNNFRTLPQLFYDDLVDVKSELLDALNMSMPLIENGDADQIIKMRRRCDDLKDDISAKCKKVYSHLRSDTPSNLSVLYVYLNLLQESQELISSLRKLLRASLKLRVDSARTSDPSRVAQ